MFAIQVETNVIACLAMLVWLTAEGGDYLLYRRRRLTEKMGWLNSAAKWTIIRAAARELLMHHENW